jgi:hypothetical protein
LVIPCIEDEYVVYKIHHIAILMSTNDGKGILGGYLGFKRKVEKHLRLIDSLGKTLNRLHIKWLDWDEFKEKRRRIEWTTNKKTGKRMFRFEDLTTHANYDGNLKNTH